MDKSYTIFIFALSVLLAARLCKEERNNAKHKNIIEDLFIIISESNSIIYEKRPVKVNKPFHIFKIILRDYTDSTLTLTVAE